MPNHKMLPRHRCGHAADLLWPDPSSLHYVPCLCLLAAPTPDDQITLGIVRPWLGCSQGASCAWGSQKVMSMARYIAIAVDNSARACSCRPVLAYSVPR